MAGAATITVGTLNVGGLRRPRPPLRPLPERVAELCRRLDEASIDVLNLQEVFEWPHLRILREHLPGYPHLGFRPRSWGPAGGLVTFSRLPLGRASFRSFIGVHATMGSLRFRLRHLIRGALHGVLVVDLAALPVTIVNTHLTANKDGDWSVENRHFNSQRGQLARLNRVLARVRRRGLLVVGGDYNIASDSVHYPQIVGGRRDPFAGSGLTTFHPVFLPPGEPAHRIDYLLVDGDERRYPVLGSDAFLVRPVSVGGEEIYLSDHIGLSVTCGLGG